MTEKDLTPCIMKNPAQKEHYPLLIATPIVPKLGEKKTENRHCPKALHACPNFPVRESHYTHCVHTQSEQFENSSNKLQLHACLPFVQKLLVPLVCGKTRYTPPSQFLQHLDLLSQHASLIGWKDTIQYGQRLGWVIREDAGRWKLPRHSSTHWEALLHR